MTKADAKKRIKKLREVIAHHRYLYHVLDTQEISDAAHDSLKHELFELEQQFPDLITKDSPTQRVGGEPREAFKKVKHLERMLSMEDVFTLDELEKWAARAEKVHGKVIKDFYCMTKVDGLAISLVYKDGVLEVAATRGNGLVGEEVTQNAKTIESIPLRLKTLTDAQCKALKTNFGLSESLLTRLKSQSDTFEVRGEIYMRKDDFEKMNRKRKKAGEAEFANPRNVSAGSIRQLDSKITASRPLRFLAWHLGDIGQTSQEATIEILRLLGFKTVPGAKLSGVKDVDGYFKKLSSRREKLDYWIDGVVVRVDNLGVYKDLGVVGKTPRGLVAWKFPPEESTTRVVSVAWSVGRTGKLTPIATVEPTFIAGTTVTHATLHNLDEIKRLGVKVGDTVILTKAGDIIPKITSVLEDLRTGKETSIRAPQTCPVCEAKTVSREGAVDLVCSNKSCFSIERERILHAARAFDVMGLGGKTVERFITEGLLGSPLDLFRLTPGDIDGLEGFGDVSAKKLVDEIASKKQIDFSKFITALSISNVGEQTAIDLAQEFGSIQKLAGASNERLVEIKDVGEIVANSIVEFFASDRAKEWLEGYEELGITINAPKRRGSKLKGKTFVLTGSLSTMTRDEATASIRMNGGDVSSSVSKKTNYVVAGSDPGSKFDKAKDLGIPTLSEKAFSAML